MKMENKEMKDYNCLVEVPGMSEADSKLMRFHSCLDEQLEKLRGEEDDELYAVAVLEALADGCNRMGLSQEYAVRMAGFQGVFSDINRDVIKSVFHTAYLKKYLKSIPLKYMRPSALLTFKTEAYMKEHYELRLNVMTGVPEYKLAGGLYGFSELDQKARNTMSINALKAGVDSWDKDLNRYIDSLLIPQYEPLRDYMKGLPKWDGRDRITALAGRVKTENKYWADDFHKWMLSMVAQWLCMNKEHGNAIVPLLIGQQGSGKTTFCRRLLPECLQRYYNDRLPMKNDNDIYIAMASQALINIDEFDALSKSQQPILKYLLSKHDVKMRQPYGKVIEQRQRFASFIATTNDRHPLVDATGSRRFVCVCADTIDNKGKINHDQIYAQLKVELDSGMRYWFSDKENSRIIHLNEVFQKVSNYPQMIARTFTAPEETPLDAPFMPLGEVMSVIARRYTDVRVTNGALVNMGKALRSAGYEQKHARNGSAYRIIERIPSPVTIGG